MSRWARSDRASVVAGLAVLALGTLVLLDAAGGVKLRFAWLAPAVCAALGATLLAAGLTRRP